jgi:hypothetical protein
MKNIFRGNDSVNVMELCDALGWANDLKQEDLVGAIMGLCHTVHAQNRRIDAMSEELLRMRGPGHGMTVAEERDIAIIEQRLS